MELRLAARNALRSTLIRHRVALGLGGFVLAVITWQHGIEPVGSGLDPSWEVGLHMGHAYGLDAGTDYIYTFGPAGFLHAQIVAFAGTFRWMFLYSVIAATGTAIVFYLGVRQTFGVFVSVLVAWIGMSLLIEVPVLVLAMIGALLVVRRRAPLGVPLAAGMGAIAGLEVLGKLSIGIGILVVFALAVLGRLEERRRALIGFASGFGIALIGLWLALGQSLTALPGYLRYGLNIVSGYSAALGTYDRPDYWQLWAALVVGLVAMWGIWMIVRDDASRPRVAALLIVLAAVFLEFKEGFTFHAGNRAEYFFSTMFVLMPALGWGARRRVEAVLATGLVGMVVIAMGGGDPAAFVNPRGSWSLFRDQARLTYDSGRRNAVINTARASLIAGYKFDRTTLSYASHGSVAVVPWEASVIWAYQLHWHPLPDFQDYQTYTKALDDLNADEAASDSGPDIILRQNVTDLGGRLLAWDPPREQREILCHFRQVHTQGDWQVLKRVADRCGHPRDLKTVHAKLGEAIPIPPASGHGMVVAYVDGLQLGPFERLRTLLYKPENRYAILSGLGYFHVMPNLSEDGMILSAPPDADYTAPFTMGPVARMADPKTIIFFIGDAPTSHSGDVTVRFVEIPITGAGVAS